MLSVICVIPLPANSMPKNTFVARLDLSIQKYQLKQYKDFLDNLHYSVRSLFAEDVPLAAARRRIFAAARRRMLWLRGIDPALFDFCQEPEDIRMIQCLNRVHTDGRRPSLVLKRIHKLPHPQQLRSYMYCGQLLHRSALLGRSAGIFGGRAATCMISMHGLQVDFDHVELQRNLTTTKLITQSCDADFFYDCAYFFIFGP